MTWLGAPDIGSPSSLQQQLSQMMDGTKLMVEMATGYRQQLIAAGWPEPAAVEIAGKFLLGLQDQMFAAATANTQTQLAKAIASAQAKAHRR